MGGGLSAARWANVGAQAYALAAGGGRVRPKIVPRHGPVVFRGNGDIAGLAETHAWRNFLRKWGLCCDGNQFWIKSEHRRSPTLSVGTGVPAWVRAVEESLSDGHVGPGIFIGAGRDGIE